MDYYVDTLKNGLRLITAPMPHLKSATVIVGVGAGSRCETANIKGLFHFIEHMAFKGTRKRPTTMDIASEVESVGGVFNAFTDKEITAYHIKISDKHVELAFDILSDMLANSLYKQEEIDREKGVIIEEINMYEDTPMMRVWEIFTQLLYGDNPMGWSTAGDKQTVAGIKRQDFLSNIEKYYYPQNLVVAVAGGVENKEMKGLAEKFFGSLQKGNQKVTETIKIEQYKPRTNVVYKKTDQAHFCLGVPGYDLSHKDRYILAVLSAILGGGMSSRLFMQIRERRGLAYYVRCEDEYYTDSGFLAANAGVKVEKVKEAIRVALDEFEKIKTIRVSAKELKKVKEMIKGQLVLALEDSMRVAARYLSQILFEDKIRTVEQTMAEIDKVTEEDILRVAKDVLNFEKINLALIGPYKNFPRVEKI